MIKKITSVLIIAILLTLCVLILTLSDDVINSVLFSISIWKDNLFPTLFPFFVLSNLLITYGFADFLGEILKNFMGKWFHLSGKSAFVLGISMISGFPSSAKFTRELVVNGDITTDEGSYLLTFTHFSNPLFIIGTIGGLLLQNKLLGFVILGCHFLTNFLIAFLFRRKEKVERETVFLSEAVHKIHQKRIQNPHFGTVLSNAIFDTMKTLVLLLGIVTIFLILSTILNNILPLQPFAKTLVCGLLEMTQGVKYASLLSIPLVVRAVLMTAFISFGGLSVHMQVMSIIGDTKIKYKYFFVARLLHALLASLLVFCCFYFFSL